jgi:PAS domain S-box-containing protein
MAEGIVIQDLEGKFDFVNPAASKLLGYSDEELLGMHWAELVPEELHSVVAAADERRSHGESDQYDLQLIRKDGSRVQILVHGSPLSERGTFEGSIAVFTDITHRVEIENELQRRLKEQTELREAAGILSSSLELDDVLSRIVEIMGRAVDATSAYISSYDGEKMSSTVLANYFSPRAHEKERVSDLGVTYNLMEEFPGTIEFLEKGIPDHAHFDDPEVGEFERRHMVEFGAKSTSSIPIKVGGEVIAYAEIWESERKREFTQEEINYCQTIAHHAGLAIQNSRLYERAREEIADRTIAEEALRESEEQHRHLVENANDIIYKTDINGNFTFVNPVTVRVMGYSKKELIGKDYLDLIRPDWRQDADRFYRLQLAEKTPNTYYEFPVVTKGGEELWMGQNAQLVMEGDLIVGFQAVTRDITERKQVEQALVDSEYLLRESQKVAGLGSYVLDIPSAIWESSPVLDNVFGINEEFRKDVQGWLRIVAPEDQAMMQDYFATNVLINHESFNKEYRIQRINDQQERWVHGLGELEFNDDGKPIKMIGTIQDITERKQAEVELQRQTERLATLREIDQAILAARSPSDIAQSAIDQLGKLVGAERISVTLFDFLEDVNIISSVQVHDQTEMGVGARIPLRDFVMGEELKHGRVHRVDDIGALEQLSPVDVQLQREGVQSYINLPLIVQEELIGSLNLGSHEKNGFNEEKTEIAREVADSLATALQHARLFEQVQTGRDRLQHLSRQLVNAQEAERRNIAQELHDEIGQLLTGLKLTIQMSKEHQSEAGIKETEEAELLLDELLKQVRDLSLDLRPAMLDDLGLLPALLWHIERFQGQTGIKVSFEHSDIADRRFILEVETTAYRIVQEALTNVARHASVEGVLVRVECANDTLLLEIADEGVGFDVIDTREAEITLGLVGMQERAIMLGGRFNIESEIGRGTKVVAELPLERRLERRRAKRES